MKRCALLCDLVNCSYAANCFISWINVHKFDVVIMSLSMYSVAFVSIRQEANPCRVPQGGGAVAN